MNKIQLREMELALQDELAIFVKRSNGSVKAHGAHRVDQQPIEFKPRPSGKRPAEPKVRPLHGFAIDPKARPLAELSVEPMARPLGRPSVQLKAKALAWLTKAHHSVISFFWDLLDGSGSGGPGDWRTPARRGLGVAFLTFFVFGGWACLASIDGAVVAAGSIVVESDRKTVQHLEGGIVKDLMVTGVAHVEQGQVLLRLDFKPGAGKGGDVPFGGVFGNCGGGAPSGGSRGERPGHVSVRPSAEGLRPIRTTRYGRSEAALRRTTRCAKDRDIDS